MLNIRVFVLSLLIASPLLAQVPKPATKPVKPAAPVGPPKTLKQMLTPTLISLECKDANSMTAVALLEKQLGFSLTANAPEYRADDQGKITCSYTNQPYWNVIRDVCVQGDLRVSAFQASGTSPFAIGLRRAENRDCMYFPAKVDSALVPSIMEFYFSSRRMPDGSFGRDRSNAYVRMWLLAEPKVFVAGYKRRPEQAQAVDDGGNALIDAQQQQPRMPMGNNGAAYRDFVAVNSNDFPVVELKLRTPTPPAKTIKKYRGTIPVVFGFDLVTADLTPALQGKEARIPLGRNNAIAVGQLMPAPAAEQAYTLTLALPQARIGVSPITDAMELRSMRLMMTDDKGNAFRYEGLRTVTTGNDTTTTARFRWPTNENGMSIDAKPAKLTCILPTRLEEAEIPFDFNDVVVPEPPK